MEKYTIIEKVLRDIDEQLPNRGSENPYKDSIWNLYQSIIQSTVESLSEKLNADPLTLIEVIDQNFKELLKGYITKDKAKTEWKQLQTAYRGEEASKLPTVTKAFEYRRLPLNKELSLLISKFAEGKVTGKVVQPSVPRVRTSDEIEDETEALKEAVEVGVTREDMEAVRLVVNKLKEELETWQGGEDTEQIKEKKEKLDELEENIAREEWGENVTEAEEQAGDVARGYKTALGDPPFLGDVPLEEERFTGGLVPEEESGKIATKFDYPIIENMILNSLDGNPLAQFIVKELHQADDVREIAQTASILKGSPWGVVSPSQVNEIITKIIRPVVVEVYNEIGEYTDAMGVDAILKKNKWLERK